MKSYYSTGFGLWKYTAIEVNPNVYQVRKFPTKDGEWDAEKQGHVETLIDKCYSEYEAIARAIERGSWA